MTNVLFHFIPVGQSLVQVTNSVAAVSYMVAELPLSVAQVLDVGVLTELDTRIGFQMEQDQNF